MAAVRAVLFDLDDTLVDQRGIQYDIAQRLQRHSGRLAEVEAQTLASRSMFHMDALHALVVSGQLTLHDARVERYRRLLHEFAADTTLAESFAIRHRDNYLALECLVPGAAALVEALHARGLSLAIVSNSARDEQQRKLNRFGLMQFFDALIVSADHGISKPDARLFALALDALGVAAEHSVMVGDSWLNDIHGANRAGIRAVWLNRQRTERPDATPARELDSLVPLPAAIAAICGPQSAQTITGSGSSITPNFSRTLSCTSRASARISAPVAPPRFTSTSACFS